MKISILQNKYVKNILVFVFWILVWQLLSNIIEEEILFVSPLKAFRTLILEVQNPLFWVSIRNSMVRISLGFIVGLLLGIILAVFSYKNKVFRELVNPLMLLVKATPVVSFIILALVFVGSKNLSLLISALMAVPLVYFNILEGISSTNSALLTMANLYGISILDRVKYIYMDSLKPFIMSIAQTVIGLCIKSGIAAEVIGVPINSLGEKLYLSKIYLDTSSLFAYSFVIIILGLVFEKLVILLVKEFIYD